MVKSRLTSKGQVTIPKSVRERLGPRPGDEIEFVEEGPGVLVKKHLADFPFVKYRGYLKDLAGRDPDELVEEMRGPRSQQQTRTDCWTYLFQVRPMLAPQNVP